MSRIRAVAFDLDGTLFDHRGSARVGVERFLRGLGVDPTEDAVRSWFAAEDVHFERWRAGTITFADQRRARLRAFLPALGVDVPDDDGAVDALFERYRRAYRDSWRAFPDALPLLGELRAAGYRLGLLTNGSEEQQLDKLRLTGLADAFDVVCTSERIGAAKPEARAFGVLADELGVEPAVCLFVGDDAARDVAGARAVGMHALRVDRSRPGAGAALRDEIRDVTERRR